MIQCRWGLVVMFALGALLPFRVSSTSERSAETVTFETWREPNEGAYMLDVPVVGRLAGGSGGSAQSMCARPLRCSVRSGFEMANCDCLIKMHDA